jgi:hypothetical protein
LDEHSLAWFTSEERSTSVTREIIMVAIYENRKEKNEKNEAKIQK